MTEINTGSVGAGSPDIDDLITPSPSANAGTAIEGGEQGEVIKKEELNTLQEEHDSVLKQKSELETKLGEQGSELGDLRDFVEGLEGLLEPLREDPELVQAIIDGKVNSELIKPVLEGKVSTEDAGKITEAQKEIKKEMGSKKFGQVTGEELSEKLLTKMADMEKNFDKKIATQNQEVQNAEVMREHKREIQGFIQNTPDYADHAESIVKYAEAHPEISDIKVLYSAVKGEALQKAIDDGKAKDTAEAAKELALNAAAGGQKSMGAIENEDILDALIAPRSNPNVF